MYSPNGIAQSGSDQFHLLGVKSRSSLFFCAFREAKYMGRSRQRLFLDNGGVLLSLCWMMSRHRLKIV